MDDNSADIGLRGGSDPTNSAFSGKVMLATVVILAIVCIIVSFFHIYSRWYLSRRSTTHQYPLHHLTTTTVSPPQQGLDPILLKSLPTFTYSPTIATTAGATLDCAICLSDFEELETVRILPKCNHSFHLECIDMWFHSHTNCPICRSAVQPIPAQSQLADNLVVVVEVPVMTEREAEPENSSRFKAMVGPIRWLRRFLSI